MKKFEITAGMENVTQILQNRLINAELTAPKTKNHEKVIKILDEQGAYDPIKHVNQRAEGVVKILQKIYSTNASVKANTQNLQPKQSKTKNNKELPPMDNVKYA